MITFKVNSNDIEDIQIHHQCNECIVIWVFFSRYLVDMLAYCGDGKSHIGWLLKGGDRIGFDILGIDFITTGNYMVFEQFVDNQHAIWITILKNDEETQKKVYEQSNTNIVRIS